MSPRARAIALCALAAAACGRPEHAPAQPVAFSHALHARMEIDCGWCHRWAERHAAAGLPRARSCAGCHKPASAGSIELARLAGINTRGEEIVWARVAQLPRYNRFTHRRHIEAKIDCAVCHGEVAAMEATAQAVNMTMAWCVECHDQSGAGTDCLVCHL